MYLSPRWIIFLGMTLVLCTLVANLIEATAPVSAADTATIFGVMQKFEMARSTDSGGLIQYAITITPEIFGLLLKMITWDYNFLNNFVGTIIKMIMWAISIAILIWLALAFIKR
jgi:hypothetical protein